MFRVIESSNFYPMLIRNPLQWPLCIKFITRSCISITNTNTSFFYSDLSQILGSWINLSEYQQLRVSNKIFTMSIHLLEASSFCISRNDKRRCLCMKKKHIEVAGSTERTPYNMCASQFLQRPQNKFLITEVKVLQY